MSDGQFSEDRRDLKQRFAASMPPAPRVDVDQLLGSVRDEQVSSGAMVTAQKRPADVMFRFLTLASLAGILAMLAFTLSAPVHAESFSFEAVKKRIDEVRTVQFTTIRTEPRDKAVERFAKGTKLDDEKFTNGLRNPEYTETMILGKHRKRYRHLTDPDSYYVDDLSLGVSIFIDEAAKTYNVLKGHKTIDMKGNVIKTTKPQPSPEVDLYRSIKEVPVDELTAIGEAYIDGKKSLGFRRVEKQNLETWTRTYWIDAKTRLPVRLETRFRSSNPMISETDFVQTNFVFDEPLDESLFAVQPAGYERKEPQEVLGIDPYGKPEKKDE